MASTKEASFDLWADFDAARESSGIQNHTVDESTDEEDEWGILQSQRDHESMKGRVCRLPDGDIHVCGDDCQHAIQGTDAQGHSNGDFVCIYTGRVVARCCEVRTDLSTGRSTWSSDPDMNGGGMVSGKWRKKRDQKKDSKAAYMASQGFDDSAMPAAIEAPMPARTGAKRGALCVDELPPVETGPKRIRVSKKDVASSNTQRLLIEEASSTLGKLFGKHSSVEKKPAIDPRLLDFDLLFTAAVKKYLKETAAKGGRPLIDDIHNISLAVHNVIADEKRKLDNEVPFKSSVHSMQFRSNAARLAVALWTGSCMTTYLSQARRGADSFRPFCVGVFYALKRGLALADGTVLVPRIDDFSSALPNSKAISADPNLKSLHASSHRGLCTIHRAIAAAGEPSEARKVFAETIRIARVL
tara:strand:+ start:2373 stop:3614 length:1242 start_codon:yes stop_codon:yes gene_type:complete